MGGCCQSRDKLKGFMNFSYEDFLKLKNLYEENGQGHVFKDYEKLTFDEQQSLMNEAYQIVPQQINQLYRDLVKGVEKKEEEKKEDDKLEPIEHNLVSDKEKMSEEERNTLRQIGFEKIKEGKVVTVILAGGQGTRLGSDRPKGEFNISLPSQKSIFQILTERWLKAQMLAHGTETITPDAQTCKLLIMTSRINHHQTQQFFEYNKFFGAKKENIVFFEQAVLPAISEEGKILLEAKGKLVMAPNGNGALFDSVNNNPIVKTILSDAEYVQVIGVDNVLNKLLDPVLIGFAVKNNLQAVMKSCIKRDAKEPVGVVVKKNGKYDIVEYSEISEQDVNAVDEKTGELKFNLGNILIFLIQSHKMLELSNNLDTMNKLYHKAFKKIPYYDQENEKQVKPESPNGYKFELFIHNFLPFCDAGKFGVMKVAREDEFAPVKNATGVDSPESARELIFKQGTKWLKENGAILKESGHLKIEVDPLVSYEGEGLKDVEGKKIPSEIWLKPSEFAKFKGTQQNQQQSL